MYLEKLKKRNLSNSWRRITNIERDESFEMREREEEVFECNNNNAREEKSIL